MIGAVGRGGVLGRVERLGVGSLPGDARGPAVGGALGHGVEGSAVALASEDGTPPTLGSVTSETAAAIERLERSGIVREFEHALRVDVGYSVELARAALRGDADLRYNG